MKFSRKRGGNLTTAEKKLLLCSTCLWNPSVTEDRFPKLHTAALLPHSHPPHFFSP